MRKRRVVGRIYGTKYSWKGHKDRNTHKNRIKRSGQAWLVYVFDYVNESQSYILGFINQLCRNEHLQKTMYIIIYHISAQNEQYSFWLAWYGLETFWLWARLYGCLWHKPHHPYHIKMSPMGPITSRQSKHDFLIEDSERVGTSRLTKQQQQPKTKQKN